MSRLPTNPDNRPRQLNIDTIADLQEAGFGPSTIGKQVVMRCVECQLQRGVDPITTRQIGACTIDQISRLRGTLHILDDRAMLNVDQANQHITAAATITVPEDVRICLGRDEPPAWCKAGVVPDETGQFPLGSGAPDADIS